MSIYYVRFCHCCGANMGEEGDVWWTSVSFYGGGPDSFPRTAPHVVSRQVLEYVEKFVGDGRSGRLIVSKGKRVPGETEEWPDDDGDVVELPQFTYRSVTLYRRDDHGFLMSGGDVAVADPDGAGTYAPWSVPILHGDYEVPAEIIQPLDRLLPVVRTFVEEVRRPDNVTWRTFTEDLADTF